MVPFIIFIGANCISFAVKLALLGRVEHPTMIQLLIAIGLMSLFLPLTAPRPEKRETK